jgi:NCAIR mutase (PurE)-related protein
MIVAALVNIARLPRPDYSVPRMTPQKLRSLLEQVRDRQIGIESALSELADLPFRDLGYAKVDHHRHLRTGFPEVVFGHGKSAAQIVGILNELRRGGANLLATRVADGMVNEVLADVRGAVHVPEARAIVVRQVPVVETGRGTVLVVSAGTSDLPVAEEAALTAELGGSRVERLTDVGVAGLHRLLSVRERLSAAEVLVVVAGMEGALPSVVAGLSGRPVVAVPTSVGYGASLGGIAALLGMLNSCAAGVTVVNIDNGFGAGYAAALLNRPRNGGAA